uniref:Uncharacterized protein n=1 Tax=Timema cristinae TaxID=61476 RepID=A0A7R9GY68_TIMCR|nr:unnamed protein product [Timema cristinae]
MDTWLGLSAKSQVAPEFSRNRDVPSVFDRDIFSNELGSANYALARQFGHPVARALARTLEQRPRQVDNSQLVPIVLSNWADLQYKGSVLELETHNKTYSEGVTLPFFGATRLVGTLSDFAVLLLHSTTKRLLAPGIIDCSVSQSFGDGGPPNETFKNIGTKAEDLLEKKKHDVEDLGEKKKQAASELLEEQAKKTGDLVWSTKDELEKAVLGGLADAGAKVAGGAGQAVDSATKAKHSAIDALDEEFGKVEKTVDGTLETASSALDEKLKEADKLIDQKRDDVVKAVTDTASKAHETKDDAASSLLEKAKGLFHCEYSVLKGRDKSSVPEETTEAKQNTPSKAIHPAVDAR